MYCVVKYIICPIHSTLFMAILPLIFGLQFFFYCHLPYEIAFVILFLVGILVEIGPLIATIATFAVTMIWHAYLV